MLKSSYFPNTSLTRLTLLVASLQGLIVIGLEWLVHCGYTALQTRS